MIGSTFDLLPDQIVNAIAALLGKNEGRVGVVVVLEKVLENDVACNVVSNYAGNGDIARTLALAYHNIVGKEPAGSGTIKPEVS